MSWMQGPLRELDSCLANPSPHNTALPGYTITQLRTDIPRYSFTPGPQADHRSPVASSIGSTPSRPRQSGLPCQPLTLYDSQRRQGNVGRHPALGMGVGEARAQSLAGWCSHHHRPMWWGNHRSSAVAKAAAKNPGSTRSFSPIPFQAGHPPLTAFLRK